MLLIIARNVKGLLYEHLNNIFPYLFVRTVSLEHTLLHKFISL
jgi:hypothetical protein